MLDKIVVRGARQHNLKNISLEIPRHKFTVITGLSGSGKSSLAFDTIYAEGQRRYIESLSAYARQFLERMEKPEVDSAEGFLPQSALNRRRPAEVRAPRSAPLLKSTTICGFCLLPSASPTVTFAANRSPSNDRSDCGSHFGLP